MSTISIDVIEAAAKRVAVKHFFCNVTTQAQCDWVWGLCDHDSETATHILNSDASGICVWAPFEDWDLDDVLDSMHSLMASVIFELPEGNS